MTLIELKSARVVLDGRTVLQDLDFSWNAGESIALSGENGAGKTTFLRLLSGELWPVPAESRVYAFGDKPTWSPLRAREEIAFVSPLDQERAVRLGQDGADGERGARLSVRDCVATGLFDSFLLHQKPDEFQQERIESILEQFDLQLLSNSDLSALSQGQLRRVLLARALVKNPRVVLLDEAASGLDERARSELFASLYALAQNGASFVFASHRSEELPAWATRWTLRGGRLEREDEVGTTPSPIVAPDVAKAIKESTVGSSSQTDDEAKVDSYYPGVRRVPILLGMTTERDETPNTHRAATTAHDEATMVRNEATTARHETVAARDEANSRAPLFQLKNVSVFLGGTPILRDLNFEWPRGIHLRVLGENGSGKTTFLRLLGGEVSPAHGGEIVRLGQLNRPIWEWRRRIALVSPHLQARFHDALSVRDALASGFSGGFLAPRELSENQLLRVEESLDQWNLRDLAMRRFDRLSYGQTRRVLLARALVASPEVVLLDEALDGLDFSTREFCFEVWAQLARSGTHFAFASHHETDFPAWANGEIRF